MKIFVLLFGIVLLGANLGWSQSAGVNSDWELGPFTRPADVNPVIKPDTNSIFDCPMRGHPVCWEGLHTFNPAAVVKDGKVAVLYRAEDDSGEQHVGGHTSRIGLAESRDGLRFTHQSAPVLFPAADSQKENEWDGGCEDPRVVETEDGTYVLLYTEYNRRLAQLAVATSRDLLHWEKHGPAFARSGGDITNHFSKSAAILTRVVAGRLKAVRYQGKYLMYWGEGEIRLASSDDLINWEPGPVVLGPRAGRFDSILVEAGPPAVLTKNGIVLIYNAKNAGNGDPTLKPGVYTVGQALFDTNQPTALLQRTDTPCYKPEADFEKSGQYVDGTTFAEGLVFFHRQWLLYYGCADSYVAVAASSKSPYRTP